MVLFILALIWLRSGIAQTPPKLPQHVTPWTPVPRTQPGKLQAATSNSAPLSTPLKNSRNPRRNVWTPIGPAPLEGFGQAFSGRITGIAADQSDQNTIYIAAAGGGVWKTTNGGLTWSVLTDMQSTLSMGAIAIAPSNPSVLYAGTGEANNSGDSNYGRGILVSTDGGATWKLSSGPSNSFDRLVTSQIAVHPADSNIAYAAMSSFGHNASCCRSGIYKTFDGGASWVNTTTLAFPAWSAVAINGDNPDVLYAGIGTYSGDAANGLYKSIDGAHTWLRLNGFPDGAGRIALAVAPSNGQILYVAAAAPYPQTGLFKVMRSDDGGETFTDLTEGTPNFVGAQGWYDLTVAVDPTNPATVYLGGSAGSNSILRSTDGGAHWTDISFGASASPHVDHHAFAFDSNRRLLDGDDGGIFRLDDPATPSWSDLNGDLNTIQFTGIGLHPTDKAIAIGGSQDNGTELYEAGTWTETDGGDGGYAKISQQDGSRMYHQIPVASFGPNFFRRSDDGGHTWLTKTDGISVDLNNQNFYAPFVVDPANGNRVLYGTNRVWETTNGGDDWIPISDIGTAGFNDDPSFNVDAIGLSPSNPDTIYAVVDASFPTVYGTTDHGATWSRHNVGIIGARANDLQVDPDDANTAYLVLNGFNSNEFSLSGNVFRTTDGGVTWISISGNLPGEPVWSLQIDPTTNPHTLYIGADDGVYVSTDLGTSWSRFGTGLPNAQAVQLEFNRNLHLLGVATHGRGMWEIETTPAPIIVKNITSSSPDGTYGTGSLISIQVIFSGDVYVTGAPKLALNSGGFAKYHSGSGNNTLIFTYRVRSGQNSHHLDYRSVKALRLHGGAIYDADNNPVTLTLSPPCDVGSLAVNTNIVIDTKPDTEWATAHVQ